MIDMQAWSIVRAYISVGDNSTQRALADLSRKLETGFGGDYRTGNDQEYNRSNAETYIFKRKCGEALYEERKKRRRVMRMQEPEEWRSSGQSEQEWQAGQEYSGYRVGPGRYEQEQQKIYPQAEREPRGRVPAIVTMILSAIGLGPAIVGIVASGIVLYYADGQHYMLVGGIMGLIGSILTLLFMIAIFVINIVALALSELRRRER